MGATHVHQIPRQNAMQLSSHPTNRHLLGVKVHYGSGCDYCGMFPIVGERYKCIDCREREQGSICMRAAIILHLILKEDLISSTNRTTGSKLFNLITIMIPIWKKIIV